MLNNYIDNEDNMQSQNLEILTKCLNDVLKLCDDLNLNGFKGIKIVNDSLLPEQSDARMEDKLILLPKLKTENYIKMDKIEFIKSNIYHEMCHIHLWNRFPNIHKLHSDYQNSEDYIKTFTILVYIEYYAQLMSTHMKTKEELENFFDSVNNRNWNFYNPNDCIWFVKSSPYIIAKLKDERIVGSMIKNVPLRIKVKEVEEILDALPIDSFSDNYEDLSLLENYISRYIENN